MLPGALTDRFADLAADNHSGATWLITEAADAVAEHLGAWTAEDLAPALPDLARTVAAVRPSMAPFWNFANDIALMAETGDPRMVARGLARVCTDYSAGVPQRLAALAPHAAEVLSDFPCVLTHSLSHTVVAALTKLHDRRRLERVVCTAGEPAREGRALAAGLAHAGIPVTYTTDAGVFPFLSDVDALVLGADAVGTAGVRNKTGSYGLAAAAHDRRMPTFVLCDTTKFVPARYARSLPTEPHAPEEVWRDAPPGVTVVNYYFDMTPLDLVTGVVTERGLLAGRAVQEELAQRRVARLWAADENS